MNAFYNSMLQIAIFILLFAHVSFANSESNCAITGFEVYDIECTSDTTYLVSITFQFDSVPGDSFDISDRQHILGSYLYDSLPIRIEVPVSGLDYELLKVSDHHDPHCSNAEEFMVDCGSSGQCHIYDLQFYNIECLNDSVYLVSIDFGFDSVPGDSFDISDRHHILGSYLYDSLPIRIEVPVSSLDYELLKVSDHHDPHCSNAEEFMVDCGNSGQCHIYDLQIYNIECLNDSVYLASIYFGFDSVPGNSFDISDRHHILGSYLYDSLPTRIEVPVSGLDYELLKVSDHHDPHCSNAEEFMVDCGNSGQCHIYDLQFYNIECPTDSTFIVTIDFNYDNTTNDHFDLFDRDSLIGYFGYNELPIRIQMNSSGHNSEYVKVSDNDNPGCFGEAEFEIGCLLSATNDHKPPVLHFGPNPCKDILSIQLQGRSTYQLINSFGAPILMGQIINADQINVEQLPSGLYILQIKTGKHQLSQKIIKL